MLCILQHREHGTVVEFPVAFTSSQTTSFRVTNRCREFVNRRDAVLQLGKQPAKKLVVRQVRRVGLQKPIICMQIRRIHLEAS